MGFSFYFSNSYPASYILCVFNTIQLLYLNFRAVLGLPKTASSAQAHESMSFIWIVWNTLYGFDVILDQKIFDGLYSRLELAETLGLRRLKSAEWRILIWLYCVWD